MSRPQGQARIVFHPKGNNNVHNHCFKNDNSSTIIPSEDFQTSSATTMYYKYPVKLLVPEFASTSSCQWVYFMSYGGGLVEGDDLSLDLQVHGRCCIMLTTQASTKVFHCEDGKTTKQSISCTVGPGSLLAVLPDPLVPYKQAIYVQKQKISMSVNSNLVLLDWLTAGRVARGEIWQMESVKMINEIEVEGEVMFREAQLLQDTPTQTISTAMKGHQVVGLLVVLGPELVPLSKQIQAVVGKQKSFGSKYSCESLVSVSTLQYKVNSGTISGCVVRFVGTSTSEITDVVISLLEPLFPVLGGNPLDH